MPYVEQRATEADCKFSRFKAKADETDCERKAHEPGGMRQGVMEHGIEGKYGTDTK